MITQKEVKTLFDYDYITGILTRRSSSANNKVKIGDEVGFFRNGYLSVGINYEEYLVHRIIWLWYYGYMPEGNIDHKDRIRHHNWIDNLRERGQQCNSRNTGNQKNNTSGVKGIIWNKCRNKWASQIMVDGKCCFLYYGDNFEEAIYHRYAGEQCLDWQDCDSSSPAFIYIKELNKS